MIVNYWPKWFRQLYGGVWPRSYCCVDIESSGFSVNEDVVTEWGHCLVEDGEVVDRLSVVIDWTDRTVPPDWWVQRRLEQVRHQMELAGKRCHMSYARMKDEGMKPEKAFEFIGKFTAMIRNKKIPFVLHNGFFDEKMLSANFIQFGFAKGYTFGDVFIDTEGIEKASQITDNVRMHPRKNDTLRDYFTRVKYTRVNGVRSNMEPHCYTKYRFHEKYGIDNKTMHGAETDSYCCHVLMREFSALITDPQTPPIYPTEDSKAARRPEKPIRESMLSTDPGLKRIRGQRNS
jgi:hypothetical protein